MNLNASAKYRNQGNSMRVLLRYLFIALSGVVLVGVSLALHTWYAKPLSIDWFYTRSFAKFVLDEPELLTSLRLFERFGIRGHNAKLGDSSIAADEERNALLNETLATLRKYSTDGLVGQAAISHAIFDYSMKQRVDAHRWRWHSFPVTQLGGVHTWLPSLMIQQQRIDDATDATHYVARLNAFPLKMEQMAAQIEARQLRGIVPPKFAVDKTLAQLDAFIGQSGEQNPLYIGFADKLGKVSDNKIDAAKKNAFKLDAKAAIDRAVIPAFQLLQRRFVALQKVATKNDGAWSLPDGAAYYQYAIEAHTTTAMSAEALHELGRSDVARIGAEMDAILSVVEPAPGTRAEKIKRILDDPKRRYEDSDAGRAAVLNDYQRIIDEIAGSIDSAFRQKPSVGVVVKRVPEFAQQGAPAAYYESPPLDRSAPGIFFANLHNVNSTPKHGMRTLAYHEAIPGHHYQTAIAQHIEGLPMFRSFVSFTAYDEGWALYAERLAWELGFQKDPHDNLGRLQDEMLRAVRLVVDTGIHAKRWSREEAIAFMVAQSGMLESEVVIEVERYFVDPGQALAYKVGMFKILELRDRAKNKLGSRFDVRDFHDVVIGNGSMPLDVLERVVDEYIVARQNS
jgi:uncharacterized protein (DUF885 family)